MVTSQIRQNQQIYLRNMALLAIFAGEIAKRRQKIIFAVGVRGEPSFFICVLNPIKYTDPTGKWIFALGVGTSAGAGTGGQSSAGIVIGYSKKDGLSIGVFTSTSIGSEFGATIGLDASITVAPTVNSVADFAGDSVTIGGSAGVLVTIGGDVSISTDGSSESYSANLGVALNGTAGEGHVMYTVTEAKGVFVNDVARDIKTAVDNFIVENIVIPIVEAQIP
jgi:hypothetical protein